MMKIKYLNENPIQTVFLHLELQLDKKHILVREVGILGIPRLSLFYRVYMLNFMVKLFYIRFGNLTVI